MPLSTASAQPSEPLLVGGTPVYFSGEDVLLLTAFNAAAGVTLNFTGRFLPSDAIGDDAYRPQPINEFLTPATDRSASTKVINVSAGWLLDWQLRASAGTPQIGQCYAKVEIQRGFASSGLLLSRIGRGYVTTKQGPDGPFGGAYDSLDGAGALRAIVGATPGAGAEISETVPTGARWELLTLGATLVSNATVQNRVSALIIDDGANVLYQMSQFPSQPASQTFGYFWAQGMPTFATMQQADNVVGLPIGIRLAAGFRIRTSTQGIQAGDQYSSPRYLVREWIEGA